MALWHPHTAHYFMSLTVGNPVLSCVWQCHSIFIVSIVWEPHFWSVNSRQHRTVYPLWLLVTGWPPGNSFSTYCRQVPIEQLRSVLYPVPLWLDSAWCHIQEVCVWTLLGQPYIWYTDWSVYPTTCKLLHSSVLIMLILASFISLPSLTCWLTH